MGTGSQAPGSPTARPVAVGSPGLVNTARQGPSRCGTCPTSCRETHMPEILFIPDTFTDHRMWHGVPDRIGGRAEAVHLDKYAQIPWAADGGGRLLEAVRRLAAEAGPGPDADAHASFDVVAAAGRSARFG